MIDRHPFGARHGITGLSSAIIAIVEALCGAAAPAPGTEQPAPSASAEPAPAK